jgi:hypothetical protein
VRPSPSRPTAPRSSLRGPLVALLAGLTLGGCMTWRAVPDVPRDFRSPRPVHAIRVSRSNGEKIVLRDPSVVNDTLRGSWFREDNLTQYAIPLAEVTKVEIEVVSPGRTALAVAVAGVAAGIAIAAVDDAGPSASPSPSPPPSGSGCGIYGCGSFSCPLVYSWDGARWRLDSGTFGGAITRGLQRTDVDNLDYAAPQDGMLRLRVANELEETDHLDALTVVAVDAPAGLSVAPDPAGGLHALGNPTVPVAARDFRGTDALDRVRAADGWSWESGLSGRDTARADDLRDGLILSFLRPRGATHAHLVLDGHSSTWSAQLLYAFIVAHGSATQAWYDSLDARPDLARATGARLAREAFLSVAVRTPSGWAAEGLFWEAGPEIVKRQVLDLDLSAVTGDTVTVRLETVPGFWLVDRVGLDFTPGEPLTVHNLPLLSARDAAGRDVAPLLAAVDGRDYALAHRDAAELRFAVPPQPASTSRTFLLRTTGWYRIDTPNEGVPDVAALAALGRDPFAIARASVTRLNAALARLAGGAQ